MFRDISISQIVRKFPRNFSGKLPLFFRKFPNLQPSPHYLYFFCLVLIILLVLMILSLCWLC